MSKNFIYSGFSDEISPDISRQFYHLKDLGISFFEPRGVNGRNISDLTADEARALKKYMDGNGIGASSIGSPIGKISITDEFQPHLTKLLHVIETAKILDTKYIRVFSFYIPKGEDAEVYEDEVISRMKSMAKAAGDAGIILLHENEKDIYGDTALRCLNIFKKVNSKNLKAVFDPANFVQCGEDTLKAFALLYPYIEYMHIKDAAEDGAVVPAGMGKGNIFEIIKALYQKGYQGFLSLEPHLGSFKGLSDLEIDDKMTNLEKSSPEKFALAYRHIKNIVERVENGE